MNVFRGNDQCAINVTIKYHPLPKDTAVYGKDWLSNPNHAMHTTFDVFASFKINIQCVEMLYICSHRE